jgi:hypothetical protein
MGPNMDYCAAENTYLAMQQLIDILESEGLEDRSNREIAALKDMRYTAEYLAELIEDLLDIEKSLHPDKNI